MFRRLVAKRGLLLGMERADVYSQDDEFMLKMCEIYEMRLLFNSTCKLLLYNYFITVLICQVRSLSKRIF